MNGFEGGLPESRRHKNSAAFSLDNLRMRLSDMGNVGAGESIIHHLTSVGRLSFKPSGIWMWLQPDGVILQMERMRLVAPHERVWRS